MAKLRERITIGVVGGSDLPKQKEQLGESGAFSFVLAGVVSSETGLPNDSTVHPTGWSVGWFF